MTLRRLSAFFFFTLFILMLMLMLMPAAKASFEFGAGISSATSGRTIPALQTALGFSSFTLSFLSTGVKTSLYSHSAYRLLLLKEWGSGVFLWGPISTGVGGGIAYSHRAWMEDPAQPTEMEIHSDYLIGPAWRLTWEFGGPVFMDLEALFGLRQPMSHLFLSFQDFISLTVGVRL